MEALPLKTKIHTTADILRKTGYSHEIQVLVKGCNRVDSGWVKKKKRQVVIGTELCINNHSKALCCLSFVVYVLCT